MSPFDVSAWMIDELIYFGFLYLCLHKFTERKTDRVMYALGVFAAQLLTVYFYPMVEGYAGWLLFSFVLGRVIGIYHPPVLIDRPLDVKRKILGWIAILVFILCFSPKPFDIIEPQRKEVKSDTPSILSLTNPSPYLTRMAIPYSLARASSSSMNSGEEMSVLDAPADGLKN